MKMLFFSPDVDEVDQVSREFILAGIPCEIRNPPQDSASQSVDTELWIRNDRDCHRAMMLCVQRNIGFARRPIMPFEDGEEISVRC
jgi:hypothetical protein